MWYINDKKSENSENCRSCKALYNAIWRLLSINIKQLSQIITRNANFNENHYLLVQLAKTIEFSLIKTVYLN